MDNILLDNVSIHDYATFEQEHLLPPDFLTSIRHKCLNTSAESNSASSENNNSSPLKKKKSFLECAQQVRKYEGVLLRWPKRTRHHSSSSEESVERMISTDCTKDEKIASDMETDVSSVPNTPSDPPHSPAHESEDLNQGSVIISKNILPTTIHVEIQSQHKAGPPLEPQSLIVAKTLPLSDAVKSPRKRHCCCIL